MLRVNVPITSKAAVLSTKDFGAFRLAASANWATPAFGPSAVANPSRARRAAADHRPMGSHASQNTGDGEAMLTAKPSRSLVGWLNHIADLLEDEQPAHKRGAPRSISRIFVARIATIWRPLGLKPGLAYDSFLHPADEDRIGRGGRVESTFQRYCRAALSAVADSTKISARQVTNYKERTIRIG